MSLHQHGKMIDIVSDDEGPFSPERTGRVPCIALAELCYSGKFTQRDMVKHLRGKGGLVAYLQTNKVVDEQMMISPRDVRTFASFSRPGLSNRQRNWRTGDRCQRPGGQNCADWWRAYSEMLT
jgi:hypothetical protein